MDKDIVEGLGIMGIAAGAGAGYGLLNKRPIMDGVRQGVTVGTAIAAIVTIFSTRHRDAAAIVTAVGVTGLLADSLIQGV